MDETRGELGSHSDVLDVDGGLAASRRLEDLVELLERLLEYIRRRHVDLGDDDDDRDGESEGDREMLFAHAEEASVAADDQQDEIRRSSGESEEGSLEVSVDGEEKRIDLRLALRVDGASLEEGNSPLMTCEIRKRDDLVRLGCNLLPAELLPLG